MVYELKNKQLHNQAYLYAFYNLFKMQNTGNKVYKLIDCLYTFYR